MHIKVILWSVRSRRLLLSDSHVFVYLILYETAFSKAFSFGIWYILDILEVFHVLHSYCWGKLGSLPVDMHGFILCGKQDLRRGQMERKVSSSAGISLHDVISTKPR